MSSHLHQARKRLLDWLRANHRDPSFLAGEADSVLELRHAEINEQFLRWARTSGFAYQVIKVGLDGRTAYEVHWTHRGSSFVGFKQPPSEAKEEDALLAGCAALLENEWCRKWLPK